jgi:hypothetical protein
MDHARKKNVSTFLPKLFENICSTAGIAALALLLAAGCSSSNSLFHPTSSHPCYVEAFMSCVNLSLPNCVSFQWYYFNRVFK